MSRNEKQLRGARKVAVVSVICIVVSAVIEVLLFTGTLAVKPPTHGISEGFTPAAMQAQWKYNKDAYPSLLAADLFLSAGLFLLAFATSVLNGAHPETRMSATVMTGAFFAGALVPAFGFLQNIGSMTAGNRIYDALVTSNMGNDALVSLQIASVLVHGRGVWIQALVYICLGTGLAFSGVLSLANKNVPKAVKIHGVFGIIVAVSGFVVFALDISKFFFPVETAYGYMTLIYQFFLIPIWLLWFAIIITRLPLEYSTMSNEDFPTTSMTQSKSGAGGGGGGRAGRDAIELESQQVSHSGNDSDGVPDDF